MTKAMAKSQRMPHFAPLFPLLARILFRRFSGRWRSAAARRPSSFSPFSYRVRVESVFAMMKHPF
jgi:hypothetical protein